MKNKFILILFPLFFVVSACAQSEETPTQFWVNGGVGQSVSDAFTQSPGLVAGAGFAVSHKQQLLSLQLNHFWETNMANKMQGDFNEWKIQYGWIHTKKRDQFFVAAGLSYTECNHFKEVFNGGDGMSIHRDWTTQTAFGLVGETGVNFILNNHVGLGVSSFVNFNKNALTAGYRVNILLGLFKNYDSKTN